MKTQDLFNDPKPRKKRKWLMHVFDVAGYECGLAESGYQRVNMRCDRCKSETGWITVRTATTAKRGIPCEKCNGSEGES